MEGEPVSGGYFVYPLPSVFELRLMQGVTGAICYLSVNSFVGISPYFFGVAIPAASSGFLSSNGSIFLLSQSLVMLALFAISSSATKIL